MVDDDLVMVREDPKECEQIPSLKKIQLKEWSMVVIRDSPTNDDCSIFPPINHENLPISEQHEQHPFSPSSSSSSSPSSSPSSSSPPPNLFSSSSSLSSSPSDSTASDPQPAPPPSDSQVKRAGEVTRWIGVGLEVIRCKVFALVSSFRNHDAATKGAFWSAAAAAAVFWMLFVEARQRRRRMESKGRLVQAIREKDEKITQLLHQIAQMNEVLVARHRDLTSKMSK